MNYLRLLPTLLLVMVFISSIIATPHPQHTLDLGGAWVVRTDETIDGVISARGSKCQLQLTHGTGENADHFTGSYGACMPNTIIDGVIYDDKLISAIQYTQKGNANERYCVYSGKIAPDGSICGTYYTDKGEAGDFQWIAAANYIDELVATTIPGQTTSPTAQEKPVYVPPTKTGTGARPTKYKAPTTTKPVEQPASTTDATDDVPPPTPDTQYHIVEEDDSMYRLASKYGIKLKKLLWLNHRTGVTDDKLNLGDRLRVSE